MKAKIKNSILQILSIFFPKYCVGCNKEINTLLPFCSECESELERTAEDNCILCGADKKHCVCKYNAFHFSGLVAPFYNTGATQKCIYAFKFNSCDFYGEYLASKMAETILNRYGDIEFSVITAVPLSFFKWLKRGYNQSEILAMEIAKILNIPFKSGFLKRRSFGIAQHYFNKPNKRFKNASKSFYKTNKSVKGNVLLIDDIATTNSTLDVCSKLLLYAGAEAVYTATAVIFKRNS